MKWSRDEIIALASDEASFRAGEQLAHGQRWLLTGHDGSHVWGEYPGSRSLHYRVLIRIEPFRSECDCPSRKRPCKHVLGLMLLSGSELEWGEAGVSDWPEWVSERVAVDLDRVGRSQKSGGNAERGIGPDGGTGLELKERQRAKRIAAREERVEAGRRDLERWLIEVVEMGLAGAVESRPAARLEWEKMAARMVDAQAPGLARRLRRAIDHFPLIARNGGEQNSDYQNIELKGRPNGSLAGEVGDWQGRLLGEMAMLFLALEAYRRQDHLTADEQSDLRNCIGWVQQRRVALGSPAVADEWQVQGQSREVEDRLVTRRTWLAGRKSGRIGLLIDYGVEPVTSGAPRELTELTALMALMPPGFVVGGDLHYFPGAAPLRGVLERRGEPVAARRGLAGAGSIAVGLNQFARALAANPWIEIFPMALSQVVPARDGDDWLIVDGSRMAIPLRADGEVEWRIAALSGGEPVDLFGEWDGRLFRPLTVVAAGRWSRI